MSKERFVIYNTQQENILCKKIWEDYYGNRQYNVLWKKAGISHYLLLSSSGVDSLIGHIEDKSNTVDNWVESNRTVAHSVAAFLLMNGFDTTSIIVPLKKLGASYTDELIVQGLDFVNGFRI